jgi:hypothetical protein
MPVATCAAAAQIRPNAACFADAPRDQCKMFDVFLKTGANIDKFVS